MEKSPRSTEQNPSTWENDSVTESPLKPGEIGETSLAEVESNNELHRSSHQDLGRKVLDLESSDNWKRNTSLVRAETEPDYENDLTEAELQSHPEQRFKVNPDRFPILRDQAISNETLKIDETLSLLVQDAADTVAILTGETDPPTRRADAVIYLDKSARPVSWLVNEMWEDFTTAKRPEFEGFMGIDRITWFRAVGLEVDDQGNLKEDTGIKRKGTKANFSDFQRAMSESPIRRSDLARARLALMPDGIESLRDSMNEEELMKFDAYNPLVFESSERDQNETAPELPEWIIEKVFAIPTGLEGKKIMVIDEVQNSGATAEIAKEIIMRAVNDPGTEVDTHIFWEAGTKQVEGDQAQMQSAPVWYDHDVNPELGKGIGNVNFRELRKKFERDGGVEQLNALYIAPFRGRTLNMAAQEGESSVELMKEFQRLAKIYREGRILMSNPKHYDLEKWVGHYEDLGIEFTPNPKVKNSYINLRQGLNK